MYNSQRRQQQPEESIYELIPVPKAVPKKEKRYTSKYHPNAPPTASTFGPSRVSSVMTFNTGGNYDASAARPHKNSGANFGSKEHYSDPTAYLKKTSGSPENLEVTANFSYKTKARKPAVVKANEKPANFGRRKEQPNFIKENAVAAITMDARKKSTEAAKYREKEDYGKVPEYLNHVKAEIRAEKEYIQNVLQEEAAYYQQQMQPNQMELLAEPDRITLLNQLKNKWEDVNKQYQGMTHLVSLDTIGKKNRKENFEAQLNQLEKSIKKLEKPVVFVQSSDPMRY